MVTLQDINDTIAKCEYESLNDVEDGFFETSKPSMQPANQKAEQEADQKYYIASAQQELDLAKKCLSNCLIGLRNYMI